MWRGGLVSGIIACTESGLNSQEAVIGIENGLRSLGHSLQRYLTTGFANRAPNIRLRVLHILTKSKEGSQAHCSGQFYTAGRRKATEDRSTGSIDELGGS